MRIVGGECRGRKLRSVPGQGTRPTADRVREALFDILGDAVQGARVLDLFAGTGALGLEALSRGAGKAVLVEEDPAAGEVIAANIAALGLSGAELIRREVSSALARLRERGEEFDLVLADPPYRARKAEKLLAGIEGFAILAPGGVVAVEHSPEAEPALPGRSWRLLRQKRYGRTVLSFYDRVSGNPGPFAELGVPEASDPGPGGPPACPERSS